MASHQKSERGRLLLSHRSTVVLTITSAVEYTLNRTFLMKSLSRRVSVLLYLIACTCGVCLGPTQIARRSFGEAGKR